jgi:hypothetical protein
LPACSAAFRRTGKGALDRERAPRGCAHALPYAVACASARIARSGDAAPECPPCRNAAMKSGGTGKSSPSTAIIAGLPAARIVGSRAFTLSIASFCEPAPIGRHRLPIAGIGEQRLRGCGSRSSRRAALAP